MLSNKNPGLAGGLNEEKIFASLARTKTHFGGSRFWQDTDICYFYARSINIDLGDPDGNIAVAAFQGKHSRNTTSNMRDKAAFGSAGGHPDVRHRKFLSRHHLT